VSQAAVKQFCAAQLALLDAPVQTAVYSQRPKQVTVGEQAVVVVTIADSREARFAPPRGAGRKIVVHRVRLDLYWLAADEQQGGAAFDALLQQVQARFRTASLPASLSDPATGEESVLVWIGEEIETTLNEPLLDETAEGLATFSAELVLPATEHVEG
jgi:hypothetical protein